MLSYELILPSASRPHLLGPTLNSLLQHVDVLPRRILLHDDAVFPGKWADILAVMKREVGKIPVVLAWDDPPLGHGPTLAWLLHEVRTEYVLYSQDDHVVVRPLPIAAALQTMHEYGLHQIRFNKRDTMPYKETWQGRWYKECRIFGRQLLTIADHWYFQTGLWRVSRIKPVTDWFMADLHESQWFQEHCEIKVNDVMNGNFVGFPKDVIDLPLCESDPVKRAKDQALRATFQRTFIWGGIDERAFIRHIGDKPEDWALVHPREELKPR